MLNCFVAEAGRGARPVHAIAAASYRDWLGGQPAHVRAWLEGSQFEAKPGRSALLGADGAPGAALLLHSEPAEPWDFAALRERLPPATGGWNRRTAISTSAPPRSAGRSRAIASTATARRSQAGAPGGGCGSAIERANAMPRRSSSPAT